MVEITKYVAKTLHPLAPFTIKLEATNMESALDQLKLYLDIIALNASKQTKKEEVEKKEEEKKEVKEEKKATGIGRNPLTCARARRLIQMTGGRISMVKYTCQRFIFEEDKDFKPSESFDQCLRCDQYLFTDLRVKQV
ncbi:MAG: hypothetical protein QXK12_08495 [Candidatus Nezhaarchaeales archaeon]